MTYKSNSNILFTVTFLFMAGALYLVFLYAPTEKTMGDVQRIFYFHVSGAWISFLTFAVTCFGSIGFLSRKNLKWDLIANSSAGIGLLFTTITLITGSIWGRYAWGIWWTWDARLTSILVLWLIFLSYLMLRSYIEEETKRAYISAVVGIIGFLDVPVVYFSIRWWRTQHPSPVIAGGESSGLEPPMLFTFIFCLAAFTIFYFFLLRMKTRLEEACAEVDFLFKVLEHQPEAGPPPAVNRR